mmetsp:Transcript_2936/g.11893  ORF Transcript_2936/g.11893 Transcript_2936/m.11893 type:complete len:97 (+) Transcript_2936:1429-1719(+)
MTRPEPSLGAVPAFLELLPLLTASPVTSDINLREIARAGRPTGRWKALARPKTDSAAANLFIWLVVLPNAPLQGRVAQHGAGSLVSGALGGSEAPR